MPKASSKDTPKKALSLVVDAPLVSTHQEEIDPVKKFLEGKALENVQAMQELAEDVRVHPVDRFDMRKYMVGLAGYSEKKTLEHTGKVQFEPLRISRGDE